MPGLAAIAADPGSATGAAAPALVVDEEPAGQEPGEPVTCHTRRLGGDAPSRNRGFSPEFRGTIGPCTILGAAHTATSAQSLLSVVQALTFQKAGAGPAVHREQG
jgi:hypothetical protein